MSYSIIVVVLVIYVLVLCRKWINKKNQEPEPNYDAEFMYDEKEFDEAASDLVDFEEKYFERINNGERCQQFLILGGQQDCSVIRSLLASDDIPSYVENENVNRMYGGTPAAVTGVFAIKLFILVNDYEKAYDIVCEYAKLKKREFDKLAEEKQSVMKTTEKIVTGLFFAPYPVNAEQRSMGITILPKLEIEE